MVNKKLKAKSAVILLFLIFPLFFQIFSVGNQSMSKGIVDDRGDLHTSAYVSSNTTQWLNDTSFDYPTNWTSSISGDSTDVNSTISGGEASFNVKGEKKTFSEVSGIPSSSDWNERINPEYPALPVNSNFIDGVGLYADHLWGDDLGPGSAAQEPSVHWERNISIADDMSNYVITSASIVVTVNATVEADDGNNYDYYKGAGIEAPWDVNTPSNTSYSYTTGDYIHFYAKISDLSKNKDYIIAWNQTDENLGDDRNGPWGFMYDTNITSVAESDLINYLTSVLSTDNHNFTIILGIRIHCEDNYYYNGRDNFEEIYIKNCDFTFTYEKKISKLTTVSYNQVGEKISDLSDDYFVLVTNANLSFYYKIDQEWPTSLSPSSEIRVLINNNPFPETIKLERGNTSFQLSKTTGYDVTSYITDDVIFSIQLYLRDEFGLNRTIEISIDNVSLIISYDFLTIETIPPTWIETYGWLVVGLAAGLVGVGGYFVAYELVFKYPPFVRLIRKLRKKVKKEKKLKSPLSVESRERIRNSKLKEKMKTLRIDISSEGAGSMMSSRPSGNVDKAGKGGIQK